MKTISIKQLSLMAAIAAASSYSSAGPLAPIIEPLADGLAGTPLEAIIGPLNEIDTQLSALGGEGDNPLQPILDQLQAGGGDNPLQPVLDQLQGGGENPLAPYALQLTKTVDDLANDVAGKDGTVDAVTDVVDTLATDPTAVQSSVEAIPPTLEVLFANLQENLMGFAPEGGNNPLQPLLDQLQGGDSSDNPLQPLLDQFESAAAGGDTGGGDNPLQPVLDLLPIPVPSEGGDSDSEPSALPLSLVFSFESAAFSFSFGFDGQEPVFELPTP